jgi:Fe2+ or Zn2+ uptake regulation protein
MTHSIEDLGKLLLKNQIKPSYQRMRILQYLMTRRNHPTVDQIYQELVKEMPTLSKTTVYNTLDLFLQTGLAICITIEENETRYDAFVSIHGHFKCEECGRIYDFDINIDGLETPGLSGFKVDERSVYFKGVCPDCLVK